MSAALAPPPPARPAVSSDSSTPFRGGAFSPRTYMQISTAPSSPTDAAFPGTSTSSCPPGTAIYTLIPIKSRTNTQPDAAPVRYGGTLYGRGLRGEYSSQSNDGMSSSCMQQLSSSLSYILSLSPQLDRPSSAVRQYDQGWSPGGTSSCQARSSTFLVTVDTGVGNSVPASQLAYDKTAVSPSTKLLHGSSKLHGNSSGCSSPSATTYLLSPAVSSPSPQRDFPIDTKMYSSTKAPMYGNPAYPPHTSYSPAACADSGSALLTGSFVLRPLGSTASQDDTGSWDYIRAYPGPASSSCSETQPQLSGYHLIPVDRVKGITPRVLTTMVRGARPPTGKSLTTYRPVGVITEVKRHLPRSPCPLTARSAKPLSKLKPPPKPPKQHRSPPNPPKPPNLPCPPPNIHKQSKSPTPLRILPKPRTLPSQSTTVILLSPPSPASPSTDSSVNVESSPPPAPMPHSDIPTSSPPSPWSPPSLPSPSTDSSANVESSPPPAPTPHPDTPTPSPPSPWSPPSLPSPSADSSVNVESSPPPAPMPHSDIPTPSPPSPWSPPSLPSPSTDSSVNVESSPPPAPMPHSDIPTPSPPSPWSPPSLPSPSTDSSVNAESSPPPAPTPHPDTPTPSPPSPWSPLSPPSPSADSSVNVESSPPPAPTPHPDTPTPSPPSPWSPPSLPSPSADSSVNVESSPPPAPTPYYLNSLPLTPEKQTTLLLQRPPSFEVLVAAPPSTEEIGNARIKGTGQANSSTQSAGGDNRFGSPPGAATGDGGTGNGSVAGAVVGGIGALAVLAVVAVGVLLRRKRKNFMPESGLMRDLMDEGPVPPALSAGPVQSSIIAPVGSQSFLDARPRVLAPVPVAEAITGAAPSGAPPTAATWVELLPTSNPVPLSVCIPSPSSVLLPTAGDVEMAPEELLTAVPAGGPPSVTDSWL
ncbi:hypothetical protein Vafri_18245 [Volvox africanus]|nr:hypothetical protein Vafri_18245 [Volvox africanus]